MSLMGYLAIVNCYFVIVHQRGTLFSEKNPKKTFSHSKIMPALTQVKFLLILMHHCNRNTFKLKQHTLRCIYLDICYALSLRKRAHDPHPVLVSCLMQYAVMILP